MAIITTEEVHTTDSTGGPSDHDGMTMTTDLDITTTTYMTTTVLITTITLWGVNGEAGTTGTIGETHWIGYMTVITMIMTTITIWMPTASSSVWNLRGLICQKENKIIWMTTITSTSRLICLILQKESKPMNLRDEINLKYWHFLAQLMSSYNYYIYFLHEYWLVITLIMHDHHKVYQNHPQVIQKFNYPF